MTITPIIKTADVKAPPDRAFALFTEHMVDWWPNRMTIGAGPPEAIVIEPRAGGRWFERSADGAECGWGRVLAWEPPHRLLLAWQIDANFKYDPDFETELEMTFAAHGTGARVTLEHRNLDRFGDSAARLADMLRGGWSGIIDGYATLADTL